MSESNAPSSRNDNESELRAEQRYVDMLFRRLDAEVSEAQRKLSEVELNIDPANPKAEALVQRETEYHALNAKLDKLTVAQMGLVFGRIDVEDPHGYGDNPVPENPGLDRRYVGRLGLDDRDDNYRTLLLDWRAPQARPFYLATTAHPEGVHLRRNIRMKSRDVVAINDEHLAAVEHINDDALANVGSEAALRFAMNRARTDRMHSIVETIQREQDTIIRDQHRGVMVVEGGPGTGKTAVALHRVAYLLYTWREQLSAQGVLIIGPNSTFLDYISHVLPELGETGVVLSTVNGLYPGVDGTIEDSLLTQEIKGSAEMATILKEAVRDYQLVPETPETLRVDSLALTVSPQMVAKARTRARRSRRPHNEARAIFQDSFLDGLAEHMADVIGRDPLGGKNLLSVADVDQLHDDLAEETVVKQFIDEQWPELTPEKALEDLLTDRARIGRAAAGYDAETQEALYRDEFTGWSTSDAALLDELAVLIGVEDEEEKRKAAEKERRRLVEEAQDALDILQGSANTDNDDEAFEAEYLGAYDLIDAESLAARHERTDYRSTAQRAAADRNWAYGHVIVDEAQELTPMEWRMVFRRSPARWMTLVGDTAQTGAPAGVDTWAEALEPFVAARFRVHHLTVNYRTPQEIMDVAQRYGSILAPDAGPTTSIRAVPDAVRWVSPDTSPEKIVAQFNAADPQRSTIVIGPDNVHSVKGLEFDHVIIVDADQIVAQSPQGLNDLYVALTRATQTLTIVGTLPEVEGEN